MLKAYTEICLIPLYHICTLEKLSTIRNFVDVVLCTLLGIRTNPLSVRFIKEKSLHDSLIFPQSLHNIRYTT